MSTVLLADSPGAGAALDLMRRVHRDGSELAPEYPLVFRGGFAGRVLALDEEGEPRSACALLPREFVLEDGFLLRGGLIGSVSTDPAWRGQGLASRLLADAEDALRGQGCAFALLWAPDPEFYLRRGYAPIGVEHDFVVDGGLAARLPAAEGVREGVATDAAAIHRLYQEHPARLARTARETEALLQCPRMHTLVIEREGEVAAYACLGHGADLSDAVHEWGGPAAHVLALVRAHHARRFPAGDGGLYVMAPPTAHELHAAFAELDARPAEGFLGLARVLDRRAFAELLDARLAPAGSVRLVDTPEGERWLLAGPTKETWLDDDSALAFAFASAAVRPGVARLLETLELPPGRLPLTPSAWGLDSI